MGNDSLINVINEIKNSALSKLIGLKINDWGIGSCELCIPASDNILTQDGNISNGVCALIIDQAALLAACTLLPDISITENYSLKVSVLSSTARNNIYVRSHIVNEATYLVESEVFDDDNHLIAVATNNFYLKI